MSRKEERRKSKASIERRKSKYAKIERKKLNRQAMVTTVVISAYFCIYDRIFMLILLLIKVQRLLIIHTTDELMEVHLK